MSVLHIQMLSATNHSVQFVSSFRFGFHFGSPLLSYDDIQTCQQLPCKKSRRNAGMCGDLWTACWHFSSTHCSLEDLFGLCCNSFLGGGVHAPALLRSAVIFFAWDPQRTKKYKKNGVALSHRRVFYISDHLSFSLRNSNKQERLFFAT